MSLEKCFVLEQLVICSEKLSAGAESIFEIYRTVSVAYKEGRFVCGQPYSCDKSGVNFKPPLSNIWFPVEKHKRLDIKQQ
jgi:hypothetical protein